MEIDIFLHSIFCWIIYLKIKFVYYGFLYVYKEKQNIRIGRCQGGKREVKHKLFQIYIKNFPDARNRENTFMRRGCDVSIFGQFRDNFLIPP